jgi:transcriptional regulator with XRE-family HTH domain
MLKFRKGHGDGRAGARLRWLRQQAGLTQEELAERAQLSA